MTEQPNIVTTVITKAEHDKMCEDLAVEKLKADHLDDEGEPQKLTIVETKVELRAGGDRHVHILYRQGDDAYAE